MKNFRIIAFGLPLILTVGCKDINDVPGESERMQPVAQTEAAPAPKRVFPFTRTLTDSQGRTIEANVIGKEGLEIAISKDRSRSCS